MSAPRAPSWERVEGLPDGPVVARWRARAIGAWPLVALAWASASSLAWAVALAPLQRAAWAALVTVAFGLFVLSRWGTELRDVVVVTDSHVYVRYRSGFVERVALSELQGATLERARERRWVFRFQRGVTLALPDDEATEGLVRALRARLPER